MEASDLIRKVRKIEIKSRGLSSNVFAGEYHSAFKGHGMAFSEVREYQVGDDIRSIDWNVTARFNRPFVKVFEEERELTVMLLIDVSGSGQFGTRAKLKNELIAEIAAVLSFSAIQNNDKIGVIMFSDKVEKFISPKKGSKHILRIISELLNFKAEDKKTNLSEALRYLTNAIKKRCTAFIISDFMSPDFEDALKIANNKHDLVALKVYDERETKLPSIGLVRFVDAETDSMQLVDTSDPNVRKHYEMYWDERNKRIDEVLGKCGIDSVNIRTDEDYVKPLINLFKQR
ncbi:MAG: DUF58 domain-containing protein [Bacteroidota bacterium]|nr:DUF58 domain-containing protein [Bacteroidota bacterium]MDP4225849.1 DUF58 domain-containing protein [Bacteroidota bacterium]MDP4275823.1 DUF58 domain-containing protein [Bacteroidota bacterium]